MSARDLPPLTQLEPDEAWKPWQPMADNPWTLKWAGHLYRRAAFGAPPFVPGESTWAGLQHAVQVGLDSCLEQLFAGDEQLAAFDRLMDDMTPDSNFPDQAEF